VKRLNKSNQILIRNWNDWKIFKFEIKNLLLINWKHYIFPEQEITDETLLALTIEELAELVPTLGHRKLLWNGIKKLKSGSVYQCFECHEKFKFLNTLSTHLKLVHKLTGFIKNSTQNSDSIIRHCKLFYL
jgi:hypothetical protein